MKKTPSPSLVISILALFVALSGSAYAAAKINGKNIKKGTVTSKQIKDRSIKKADLAKDARIAGPTGAAGANGKDGLSIIEGQIPSGKTVTGNFSIATSNGSAGIQSYYTLVSLPARAPVALTPSTVNFDATSAATDDEDASCTGTSAAPTAPSGKVCIYPSLQSYYNTPNQITASDATIEDTGFVMAVTLDPGESYSGYGSWAYTAP